jgi:hypothetical protein
MPAEAIDLGVNGTNGSLLGVPGDILGGAVLTFVEAKRAATFVSSSVTTSPFVADVRHAAGSCVAFWDTTALERSPEEEVDETKCRAPLSGRDVERVSLVVEAGSSLG